MEDYIHNPQPPQPPQTSSTGLVRQYATHPAKNVNKRKFDAKDFEIDPTVTKVSDTEYEEEDDDDDLPRPRKRTEYNTRKATVSEPITETPEETAKINQLTRLFS